MKCATKNAVSKNVNLFIAALPVVHQFCISQPRNNAPLTTIVAPAAPCRKQTIVSLPIY
jgi:hypothetical protein